MLHTRSSARRRSTCTSRRGTTGFRQHHLSVRRAGYRPRRRCSPLETGVCRLRAHLARAPPDPEHPMPVVSATARRGRRSPLGAALLDDCVAGRGRDHRVRPKHHREPSDTSRRDRPIPARCHADLMVRTCRRSESPSPAGRCRGRLSEAREEERAGESERRVITERSPPRHMTRRRRDRCSRRLASSDPLRRTARRLDSLGGRGHPPQRAADSAFRPADHLRGQPYPSVLEKIMPFDSYRVHPAERYAHRAAASSIGPRAQPLLHESIRREDFSSGLIPPELTRRQGYRREVRSASRVALHDVVESTSSATTAASLRSRGQSSGSLRVSLWSRTGVCSSALAADLFSDYQYRPSRVPQYLLASARSGATHL